MPYRIEPCFPSTLPTELVDVIAELARISAVLGQRLHPTTAVSLAELVRVMNCYYSNLIEGHNTRPRDIERALAAELDGDEER
jgi:Fic family protein